MPTRKNIRWKGHNYRWGATYFVTIVTRWRFCWFGDVVGGEMLPNVLGEAVERCWLETPQIRTGVQLGTHVVMPNHMHGILTVPRDDYRSEVPPPLFDRLGRPLIAKSLGSIVRGFKSASTSQVKAIRQFDEPGSIWQRGYHEHVIRSEAERLRIARYIDANPSRWKFDPENVDALPDEFERSFWKSLED